MTKKKETSKQEENKKQLEDFIGRDKFVERIINLINFSNKGKSWHFAIDGEWGSGKSFVLNMIENKLKEKQSFVIINYNAWENDFYEDPLIAILYTILDSSKLNTTLDSIVGGIKNGIETFTSILSFVPGFDENKEKASKAIKNLIKKRTKSEKLTIDNNFISYIDGLELLKNELKKITKEKSIIILVDELDRCAPDYALKVLNRLHHLFNLPNIVVLTAVNKEMLEQTIEILYGINGKNYLTKIFDLTLKLKNHGDKKTAELISKNFLTKLLPNTTLVQSQIDLFTNLIKSYTSNNARKRNHTFEILAFLFNNLKEECKNFNFLMLSSYLWLANEKDDTNTFFQNSISQNLLEDSTSWLIKDFETPNSNFRGVLGEYLEVQTTMKVTQIGIVTYNKSKEYEINEFISLVNLFRYSNDSKALKTINHLYATKFTEDDFNEIPKIIEIIEVIAFGEKN